MKSRNQESTVKRNIPSVASENLNKPSSTPAQFACLPHYRTIYSDHPAKIPVKVMTGTTRRERVDGSETWMGAVMDTLPTGILVVNTANGRIIHANPDACRLHGYAPGELDHQHLSQIIPTWRDFIRNYREVPIIPCPKDRTKTIHRHKDGFDLFLTSKVSFIDGFEGEKIVIRLDDTPDAPDHCDERISLLQMQKQAQDQIREQTILLEISQTLSSTLDLDPELILEQVRKIISFTHAGLFSIHETNLKVLAVCGLNRGSNLTQHNLTLGGTDTPVLFFNSHQTTRISNIWSNDPEAIYVQSLFKGEASAFLAGIQSWMWVPLVAKGKILGGLGIAHKDPNYFTVHHSDLAQTIANQAAITMVNAELYEHAQMYATLQERQRLARNLHDAVNQSLFSANLIADVLPKQWEKDPVSGRRSLEKLRRLTMGAMAEMRMMMVELRPVTLMEDDLGNLLRLLCDAFTGRSNIPVHLFLPTTLSLPTEVQLTIYRICQECLSNIAKHANASRVDILLTHQGNNLQFSIEDDGCGFDPRMISAGHFGISIMRERADMIGALLSIQSHIGRGSKIELCWSTG